MATKKRALGLATFQALQLLYKDAATWAQEETDQWERSLQLARAHLLEGAVVTPWKGYITLPTDPAERALLAEDLRAWGELPGLADFEMREYGGTDNHNNQIRLALMNLAQELDPRPEDLD